MIQWGTPLDEEEDEDEEEEEEEEEEEKEVVREGQNKEGKSRRKES